ncbi:hypothetical protein HNQ60_004522 [Povalibacter uvarum]|uniref:Uncharacterized protein n=1 Tax=Povalibacter uvarum TaxID=732238 RepID=A0A841HQK2_9GAMM|nr:hypothetical protein [Povalibacter uvarum]MBB6095631.1 hypothetical protein [Povalibacter uvarum]
MKEEHRIAVFRAQTANTRELGVAWTHVNRQINALILRKQDKSVEVTTKLLALIYCALAESTFSKLIHTPHCLTLDEIEQIKQATRTSGVREGWIKCAELAVRRIDGAKSNHAQNVLKKLGKLIEMYVFDPSLIRNKLAHGQWSVALNRENDAVNDNLTNEITNLDVIELYRRKHALEKLASILEDIVESPNKAHRRDYWTHLTALEEKQAEFATWTMRKKAEQLTAKRSRAPEGK